MLIQEQEIQQVASSMMNMLREDEIVLINTFYDALKAKDIEKADETFKALLLELDTNFKTEEDLMEQNGYADMQMHKNDHDLMRKKLVKFFKRWNVLKGTKEILGFLENDFKKWYIQHISKWDSQAAPHIG